MPGQEHVAEYLQSPLPDESVAEITGNASRGLKEIPVKWLSLFRKRGRGFAGGVSGRVKVTDVSILPSRHDSQRMEARVTTEITVTPDMCSESGTLHEGVIVFLIDEGSIIAMVLIAAYNEGYASPGVSQTINTVYHSQATVGTTLQIVNRSLQANTSSHSGVTEIWDKENHRLIATGSQISMPPSVEGRWLEG